MILASNPILCFEPFEAVFKEINAKFQGWEFLAEAEHGWTNRDKIKDVLSTSDIKIQIHAPFNDLNISSINPTLRKASVEEIVRTLDLAVLIDVDLVTVHPGFYSPIGRSWEGTIDAQFISLGKIYREAKERGIRTAIENMPAPYPTLGIQPEEIKHILEKSKLDLCLDIGHAFTTGKLNEFLNFKPINIHLHDNEGDKDLHLPLGQGKIDFRTVIKKQKEYRGNWVIEGRSFESLELSKEYLEALLSNE
ncbi:MAG: sugar phosphate isomerase/epimerase family protein [Thermoplasmata archaeon]